MAQEIEKEGFNEFSRERLKEKLTEMHFKPNSPDWDYFLSAVPKAYKEAQASGYAVSDLTPLFARAYLLRITAGISPDQQERPESRHTSVSEHPLDAAKFIFLTPCKEEIRQYQDPDPMRPTTDTLLYTHYEGQTLSTRPTQKLDYYILTHQIQEGDISSEYYLMPDEDIQDMLVTKVTRLELSGSCKTFYQPGPRHRGIKLN